MGLLAVALFDEIDVANCCLIFHFNLFMFELIVDKTDKMKLNNLVYSKC